MSLETLVATNAVTIQTATPTTDRYHNTILDWTSPISRAANAWVAQTSTAENLDHRDATVATLTATFPAGTVIGPHDRVVVDGTVYEVVGDPNPCKTPRGLHHWEVQLSACAG